MIVNKKIATYFKAIRILYIVSLVCSALGILSQGIDRAVTGQWYLWQDLSIGNRLSEGFDKNLIFAHLMGIWISPFLMIVFTGYESRMISRIDSAKLYEYIDIKSSNDLQNVKIQFLDNKDRLLICCQLLLDFCVAFFFAMFCSAFFTNGYFAIIFGRYLGSFVGAHLFGYVTIIFYAMCCKEKKNELLKDLPKYIEEQRKFITEKQEKEQVVNDKLNAKILTEQCGMKFFLKYYKLLIRLPIRDIEVTENYSPEEKNERLDAGKSIITQGFSKYAAQHILDNYSDLLNDDEKNIANDILAEQ